MKFALAALLIALALAGCRGAWVYREPVQCPGGTASEEKRTTETRAGRTRNIVTRTEACFD